MLDEPPPKQLRNVGDLLLGFSRDNTGLKTGVQKTIHKERESTGCLSRILGPVVPRPINASPGIKVNPRSLFFQFKSVSRVHFKQQFKSSHSQIAERKLIYRNAHHKAMKLQSVNQYRGKCLNNNPLIGPWVDKLLCCTEIAITG